MATFHEARLRDNPSSELTFTVEDLADGRAIGMADYRDLDPFAGRATVGITIGERDRWGGGYGTEALSLLVGHLFGACRLHRVELDTWSGNERAMRAFRRVGFVEEGRRRSSVRVGTPGTTASSSASCARSGPPAADEPVRSSSYGQARTATPRAHRRWPHADRGTGVRSAAHCTVHIARCTLHDLPRVSPRRPGSAPGMSQMPGAVSSQ